MSDHASGQFVQVTQSAPTTSTSNKCQRARIFPCEKNVISKFWFTAANPDRHGPPVKKNVLVLFFQNNVIERRTIVRFGGIIYAEAACASHLMVLVVV